MKRLFVCKTTWEIFVTLTEASKKYKQTGEKIEIIIEYAKENESFISEIEKLDCIEKLTVITLNQNRYLKALLFHYRCYISLKRLIKEYIDESYEVNVFVDQSVISQTFIKSGKTLNLYEHGNGNYLVGGYPNYKFIKRILGVTPGYGRDKSIEKIFLQYPDKAPKDIVDKVVKLDVSENFKFLSELEKDSIFNIFKINDLKFSSKVLLLTQPLSEDNIISEDEKVSIYQEYIEKYDSVVIKPHPRDLTNYTDKLNGDFKVISKSFPIEILNYTDIKFDTLCTVCSGSVYNFDYPVNVDIYGTEHSKQMIKVLGVISKKYVDKENYEAIEYV
ncbi:glycosyltransferase family 52 [Vibrio diabolicus]|uniref:glycosyltransferase family 52 n=1 Tax=Vibrio diabolicus TaxID=50719 RepID=UPI00375056C2